MTGQDEAGAIYEQVYGYTYNFHCKLEKMYE